MRLSRTDAAAGNTLFPPLIYSFACSLLCLSLAVSFLAVAPAAFPGDVRRGVRGGFHPARAVREPEPGAADRRRRRSRSGGGYCGGQGRRRGRERGVGLRGCCTGAGGDSEACGVGGEPRGGGRAGGGVHERAPLPGAGGRGAGGGGGGGASCWRRWRRRWRQMIVSALLLAAAAAQQLAQDIGSMPARRACCWPCFLAAHPMSTRWVNGNSRTPTYTVIAQSFPLDNCFASPQPNAVIGRVHKASIQASCDELQLWT